MVVGPELAEDPVQRDGVPSDLVLDCLLQERFVGVGKFNRHRYDLELEREWLEQLVVVGGREVNGGIDAEVRLFISIFGVAKKSSLRRIVYV